MPVPTSISELSTTPGSNSPSGSDSPSVLDDHQRTAYAFIKTISDAKAAIADTVLLTGNQTIAGTKTFSSNIVGDLTGNASGTAANVTGTVALANGGTGQTTAAAAFTALKQAATDSATGVVELATTAEAQTGTDTTRALTVAGMVAAKIQSGTPVTLTTQTAVDFTGIPSWAKRVTVLFNGVSGSGSSPLIVQIGEASVETTGYVGSTSSTVSSSSSIAHWNTGALVRNVGSAANAFYGAMTLTRMASGVWVFSGVVANASDATIQQAGVKSITGDLAILRLTTVGGTDTLDAGSVNIAWE